MRVLRIFGENRVAEDVPSWTDRPTWPSPAIDSECLPSWCTKLFKNSEPNLELRIG